MLGYHLPSFGLHGGLLALLLVAASLGFRASARSQGVYKWQDAQGRVHYGDRPPAGAISSPIRTAQVQADEPAQDNAISAVDLFRQFADQEIAAEQNFSGKEMRITGVISRVGRDIANKPYVALETGRMFAVWCRFGDDQLDALARLRTGDRVVLRGTVGKKFGNLSVDNCSVR